MATIYMYLGIYIILHSNDHAPLHVHGRYQNTESKIDIDYVNGRAVFTVKTVKGKHPLSDKKLNEFMSVVKAKHNEIFTINSDWRFKNKKPVAKEIHRLR